MEVFEGATFDCLVEDLPFLKRRLGGFLEARTDGWAITRLVGHLTLPSGETLTIRSPKAPAASVLAWMAYVDPALRSLRFLGRIPDGLTAGSLAALVARLFCAELLQAAARHGVIRQYRRIRVRTSVVRGSIDFARLSHLGGDLSRLPCIVWERLPETPLNQFLAAAVQRIGCDRVMRESCRHELPRAQQLLGGVRPLVGHELLQGKTDLPRAERPFEGACALGRLILRSTALQEGQEHAGVAFLVDLERLFERTVARAFREAGIQIEVKAPVPYQRIDARGGACGAGSMEMDLYCPRLPGGPLVVDAKYKTRVSAANLQQMVTYCQVTGARRAVLVFPAGHLADRQGYRFRGADGSEMRIDVAELATDAGDVAGWRESAKRLVRKIMEPT